MNYFDKIRSLNNLQLAYFLKTSQAELELIGLALERADNPKLYCSEDNHCIGTPDRGKTDRWKDAVYWWKSLSHRYITMADMDRMDEDPEYAKYVDDSYPKEAVKKEVDGKITLVCPNCGKSLEKEMNYCPECGQTILRDHSNG